MFGAFFMRVWNWGGIRFNSGSNKLVKSAFESCCSFPRLTPHKIHTTVYKRDLMAEGRSGFENKSSKPPNILIYTGEEIAETSDVFKTVKENLSLCLNPDNYVIYLLQPSQVGKYPWQDHTSLLVLDLRSGFSYDDAISAAKKHFENGGNVLISSGCLAAGNMLTKFSYEGWKSIATVHCDNCSVVNITNAERTVLGEDDSNKPVITKYNFSDGVLVMSEVQLMIDPLKVTTDQKTFTILKEAAPEKLEVLRDILQSHFCLDCENQKIPRPTPVYLVSKTSEKMNSAIRKLSTHWSNKSIRLKKATLQFFESSTGVCEPTFDTIPVILSIKPQETSFNVDVFFQRMSTKKLGHVVLYSDVVGTTMDILDGLTILDGAIVIAARQTQGKGRSGNQWISPPGCAMSTLHLSVPMHSNLAQSLPFIQHLMALAVVTAVRTLPGYEDLELRVKWPNDIYFGSRIKLGGVIVNSTMYEDSIHCYIGTGVNLDNRNPTMCINDVIRLHNREFGDSLATLRVEEMLALVIGSMERLVELFQREGSGPCKAIYYKYWLHSNQKLTLEESGRQVTVQGVDDCGYLLVQTEKDEILTLQPDGNGLDLMTGMLVVRTT